MIDYIEWALAAEEDNEEDGLKIPPPLGVVQNRWDQWVEHEESASSAAQTEINRLGEPETDSGDDPIEELEKAALRYGIPVSVWNVPRDAVTDGVDSVEEEPGGKDFSATSEQVRKREQSHTEAWVEASEKAEMKRQLTWMGFKNDSSGEAAENGGRTSSIEMMRQAGVLQTGEMATEGTRAQTAGGKTLPINGAAALYRRAAALSRSAGYRKPGAGLTVVERGKQRENLDLVTLDRAFARDARRYSGGFALY